MKRPLLTQVSRFDPWKDPLGVIDAYRGVKEKHPDVQLALVGSMAHDDPEGWDFYNQTVGYADGDPDIFILSNLNNIGSVEVNAFQVHSAAVIQKSIREGFGLTVTEALWKGRPTVAGRVGGIVAQIEDGVTGWLVDSPAECAAACIEILADPARARERALRGQGARAAPLPDAAPAARLARALQPARRAATWARRALVTAAQACSHSVGGRVLRSPVVSERRKLIVVSNRGPVAYGATRAASAWRAAGAAGS